LKIFLHIGWHKTGSTAIQQFLSRNRAALLSGHGVHYPQAGLIKTAHHLAAWSVQEPLRSVWAKKIGFKRRAEQLLPDMVEEGRQVHAKAMVVSSEEFSSATRPEVERLSRILQGKEVRVVCYVRRQDKYLESLYSQLVKVSFLRHRGELQKFIDQKLKSGEADYFRQFSKWSSFFPKDSLDIWPYDRHLLKQGDVRKDFCDGIGITDVENLEFSNEDVNESLSFDSVHFLRRINSISLSEGQHVKLVRVLRELDRGKNPADRTLLTPDQRLRIHAHFRESNSRFTDEYGIQKKAFDLSVEELEGNAAMNLDYGNERFFHKLSEVLPRLFKAGEDPRKEGRMNRLPAAEEGE
jgi:hypothetical protein